MCRPMVSRDFARHNSQKTSSEGDNRTSENLSKYDYDDTNKYSKEIGLLKWKIAIKPKAIKNLLGPKTEKWDSIKQEIAEHIWTYSKYHTWILSINLIIVHNLNLAWLLSQNDYGYTKIMWDINLLIPETSY